MSGGAVNRFLPYLDGRKEPGTAPGRLLLSLLGGLGRLYGGIQTLRARGYRHGLLKTHAVPRPVIAVGNLTVGGTGKTPLVLWLARTLLARGRRPAIVSRGYGQRAKGPVTVVADRHGLRLNPPMAADEAVMLARNLPGVPVLTGAKRILPIRAAVERFDADIILLDDAFQHLAVKRDLNLLLLDCQHPFGNGRLLPGGILREPASALARCDAIVLTRAHHADRLAAAQRQLTALAPDKPLFSAEHRPGPWRSLTSADPLPATFPGATPLFAFSGIARPEAFQETLAELNINLAGFESFADHHPFTSADLQRLNTLARAAGAAALLCTEKDAVKIQPPAQGLPIHFLGLELHFSKNPGWLLDKMGLL